ncbi:MAG: hypothetical protein KDD61_02820 [Bdellovibrionales bacterium]|nr:hypothetical protein [Bdellovibrionales bacterium]
MSAEFGLSCLPFGFEFNKVRTSTLPRWHQMYRLGQSEARLDDRRFYKVWRTTVRSVESSQIKLPVYASVWLRKWSQIDSKNWRQPDTVELLYQGKIDGPQL